MDAPDSAAADTTSRLLLRAQKGDAAAVDDLFARHLPLLSRWAKGRLPQWVRDITDTQDLVQETLLQTFKRVNSIETRGKGALFAYLRQAFLNRVRNEFRRARRHPRSEEIKDDVLASQTSALQRVIRDERVERYNAALNRLTAEDRELIIGRFELGMNFEQLAEAFDKPSSNAARMATSRAVLRLAKELDNVR